MFKIVCTGPESSGKTTLAKVLSNRLRCPWVPEYARLYLDRNGRSYQAYDLLAIAQGQLRWEEQYGQKAKGILVCDTDLMTIKIWSEEKFGFCDPWIEQQIAERSYDLYLLCKPDIPWRADPQRENPTDRPRLYDRYKSELEKYNRPFVEITGERSLRLQSALSAVEQRLQRRLR